MLDKDIVPVAYTPIARPGAVKKGDKMALKQKDWPDLRDNEYLQKLASKYNKTVV